MLKNPSSGNIGLLPSFCGNSPFISCSETEAGENSLVSIAFSLLLLLLLLLLFDLPRDFLLDFLLSFLVVFSLVVSMASEFEFEFALALFVAEEELLLSSFIVVSSDLSLLLLLLFCEELELEDLESASFFSSAFKTNKHKNMSIGR